MVGTVEPEAGENGCCAEGATDNGQRDEAAKGAAAPSSIGGCGAAAVIATSAVRRPDWGRRAANVPLLRWMAPRSMNHGLAYLADPVFREPRVVPPLLLPDLDPPEEPEEPEEPEDLEDDDLEDEPPPPRPPPPPEPPPPLLFSR